LLLLREAHSAREKEQ